MRTSVFALIVLCLFIFSAPASGITIYVDADAPGTNSGTSWYNAYTDLQSALSAVGTPATILIAEGTYKPTTGMDRTISFRLINEVQLRGGYAGYGQPNPNARDIELYETILSGDIGIDSNESDNSYHVVIGGGTDPNAILDGFTITAGNANGSSPDNYGGGMYNAPSSNPTVIDCTFTDNSASYAGGMFNYTSSPTVTDCTFTENSAANYGGGMCNITDSSPTITNCTFTANSAVDDGGGMYNASSSNPRVIDCAFTDNSSANDGGGMFNDNSSPTVLNCTFTNNSAEIAGGMCNILGSSPMITNCTFTENSAETYGGGAMYSSLSHPKVRNCIFTNNAANQKGGGMYNYASDSITVTNCIFTANSAVDIGGGMFNYVASPTITNSTFTQNTSDVYGGAMSNGNSSDPVITNCILWDNSTPQIYNDISSPVVTFCDVEGGYPGAGNIDVDPNFVDIDGPDDIIGTSDDDLHLQSGSPCIDAGSSGLLVIPVDNDMMPRTIDDPGTADTGKSFPSFPVIDMGAYEYQGIDGDIDRDGDVDLADFAIMANNWLAGTD